MAGQVDLSIAIANPRGRPPTRPESIARAKDKPRSFRSRADVIRKFIESRDPLDQENASRLIGMLTNMVRLASGKSPQAVAAFNVLMNRAYGLPRPSDEELESIQKQGGIQLVYIARPAVDESIPVAAVKAVPEPKFIEGEVIEED